MDGARFDAWTRRRLNVALAGGVAALFGLANLETAEGKKRKKKKPRCVSKPGSRCNNKQTCCTKKGLVCLPTIDNPAGSPRCCRVGLKPCQASSECCSGSCVDNVCSCKTTGQECGGIGTLCCSLKCAGNDPNAATCQP